MGKLNKTIYIILITIVSFFSCIDSENFIEKTYIIASKKVDCVGVETQKCFLVKENVEDNWSFCIVQL